VLRAYGISDKGPVRPTNEDCFDIDNRLALCVVADGMGGHNAGEVASRIAVDTVVDYVQSVGGFVPDAASLLRNAVQVANHRVLEAAAAAAEYAGMGTTLVAAIVSKGRLSVAHVGDSRLYLFDGGRMRLLTRDDSWMANVLLDDPDADPLLLEHHPLRGALTNVVGAQMATEIHVMEERLEGGELLALMTDGVHGVLDNRRIERVLDHASVETAAADLVAAALTRGSRDNCTAIVAQYVADEPRSQARH
jgi:protein phosphatase